MKKIMMIAALMVATLSASAQNEVGQITLKPMVGLNLSNVTKFDGKVKVGVAAGLEAEYGVAEKFGLTAGLFYSMQGVKLDYNTSGYAIDEDGVAVPVSAGATAKYKLDYLNIPIMAQYYVIPGLAIKAGVQPGFCISKKYEYEASASAAGSTVISESDKGKIEDGVKSFQFAIPVGASYEYKSFVLDARYNIYATKALKNADPRHSVFSITLGYKIPIN